MAQTQVGPTGRVGRRVGVHTQRWPIVHPERTTQGDGRAVHASGNWWEPGAWECEEWNAATSGGKVVRLVKNPDGWFVEGMLG